VGELFESKRDRDVTRRGQTLTLRGKRETTRAQNDRAAADRQSREKIAADKLAAQKDDKAKKPRATSEQIVSAQTHLDLARRQAARAKGDGEGRGGAAKLLIEGQKAIKDPLTNQEIPDTAYKSVKQLWASVALDLEYDGKVSEKNRRQLVARGYRLKDFGIKVPKRAGLDKRTGRTRGTNRFGPH
jgi:hypothetical protein